MIPHSWTPNWERAHGVVIRDTAPSTAKRPQSLGQAAAFSLCRVTAWTTANGLTLHPGKTRMGDAQEPGQGFEFLGYRFEGGRRYVRKKSLQAFKDKVRAKTGRTRGDSLYRIIGDLLADAMVKLTEHDSLSRETVRRRLAEDDLKPWRKDMWCIAQVDGAYVARREDGLALYAEDDDPKRPVICFDESPTQLIGETRLPIPPDPSDTIANTSATAQRICSSSSIRTSPGVM